MTREEDLNQVTESIEGQMRKEKGKQGNAENALPVAVMEEEIDSTEQLSMIRALSSMYIACYFFDIEHGTFGVLQHSQIGHVFIGERGNMDDADKHFLNGIVSPEHYEGMCDFMERTKWQDRLENKRVITKEFYGRMGTWLRAYLIPMKYNEEHVLTHVLFGVSIIEEEKRRELEAQRNLEVALVQAAKTNATLQAEMQIVKAFGSIYFAAWKIDLQDDIVTIIKRPESGLFQTEVDGGHAKEVTEKLLSCCIPEQREELQKAIAIPTVLKKLHQKRKAEIEYCDSKIGWCRLTIIPIENDLKGDITGALVGIQSIQDEKKAEERNARVTQLLTALSRDYDAIFYADLSRDWIVLEHHSEKIRPQVVQALLSSNSYEEIIRKYAGGFVDEDWQETFLTLVAPKNLEKTLKVSRDFSFRYKTTAALDALGVYYEMHFVAMLTDPGSKSWIIGARCIDELVKAEAEQRHTLEQMNWELQAALQEAKRANVAKSDFLSRMSHDIRTPINGILGMLDIIDKDKGTEQQNREYRNKIRGAANHLLSLINDVLDMSKLESGKLDMDLLPFDLNELLHDCSAMIEVQANEQGVVYNKHFDEIKHPYLLGTPLYLRQILLNLSSNAVKYNKMGGTFDFYVRELKSVNGVATFEFVAKDTGIGMNKEFLDHIFEPFSQEHAGARTNYKGTGLGMAITRELALRMGGTIQVESVEGEGSTFTVSLPFSIDSTRKTDLKSNTEDKNISGMHLMLVEDNDLNLEIARYMLTDAGATLRICRDGQQAVEAFEQTPGEIYDVILMDIMMPVMDGLQATRCIRESKRCDGATVPIIAMTANAFAEDIQKAKDAGMNDHVAKPIVFDELLKRIARYKKV